MTTLTTAQDDLPTIVAAAAQSAGPLDEAVADRLSAHFPRLHDAVARVVGDTADGLELLTAIVTAAATSGHARSVELRVLDDRRLAEPDRLASERMLGAVCDPARYAGNLAGLRDELPYLRELGISVLHLVGVLWDARTVDPSYGTMPALVDLAADFRLAGVSLMLDLPATGDLRALVADALHLADRGIELLRVEAEADEIEVVEAILAIATPATVVAGTADGCRLVIDRRQNELLWQALATADPGALQRALGDRAPSPEGALRATYVRDLDALSWPDLDDAAALADHFAGRLEGSSARGVALSESDAAAPAVAGTTASLLGLDNGDDNGDDDGDAAAEDLVLLAHALALSTGGLPMLVLGDEVAQPNDPTYADDPDRRDDPRWTHRGNKPRAHYAQRHDAETAAGRVFARLTKLLAVRAATPEFAGDRIVGFDADTPGVLAFQRPDDGSLVLVLANLTGDAARIDPLTLSGFSPAAQELVEGIDIDLGVGLDLAPHAVRWLRVQPR